MIRINLIAPERTVQKKRSAAPAAPGALQTSLLFFLFLAVAAVACLGGWWLTTARLNELQGKITAAEKRQTELRAIKIQVEEFEKKKTLLETKVALIEKLKAEQRGPVHMLDEISKALPDFVWLTSLDETAGALRLRGESNSLTSVADFISALQRSGWFPSMDLVDSKESNSIVTFELSGRFVDPEAAAKAKEFEAKTARSASARPGAARN
jgi:type IV pilus assembly protein PilN